MKDKVQTGLNREKMSHTTKSKSCSNNNLLYSSCISLCVKSSKADTYQVVLDQTAWHGLKHMHKNAIIY